MIQKFKAIAERCHQHSETKEGAFAQPVLVTAGVYLSLTVTTPQAVMQSGYLINWSVLENASARLVGEIVERELARFQ